MEMVKAKVEKIMPISLMIPVQLDKGSLQRNHLILFIFNLAFYSHFLYSKSQDLTHEFARILYTYTLFFNNILDLIYILIFYTTKLFPACTWIIGN